MDVIYSPFVIFTLHPWLAFFPSAAFALSSFFFPSTAGRWFAPWIPRAAAVAWFVYALWEYFIFYSIPLESVPIRIDLLLIAPILWVLTLVSVVTIVGAGLRVDRRRRSPPGHCAQCSYNLTGNTSGRCPECGAATERAT